jgi:hypothetical protein
MFQALYYGLVMVATIFFCGAFQRGFFTTYFKVRTSFGKYVMVKVRSPLRDYFMKGWVEEGFLIYKVKKGFMDYDTIRLNIPKDLPVFYRCLSVMWVDVDDEKHAICRTDYSTIPGYDAIKNNNLHTRALMKPTVSSGQEKLMLLLLVIIGILVILAVYFGYVDYKAVRELKEITAGIPDALRSMSGTITGGRIV